VFKAFAPKHDVAPTEPVENVPCPIVTYERGIEFDIRVETLFLNEVAANALNFVGRAAVHGGERHRMDRPDRHMLRNRAGALEGGLAEGLPELWRFDEFLEFLNRLLPRIARFGPAHSLDEGVHGFAFDTVERIADRHVEHEVVRLVRPHARQEVDGDPCIQIFHPSLFERELRRPLDIVSLVECIDTRLFDIESVIFLNGL